MQRRESYFLNTEQRKVAAQLYADGKIRNLDRIGRGDYKKIKTALQKVRDKASMDAAKRVASVQQKNLNAHIVRINYNPLTE